MGWKQVVLIGVGRLCLYIVCRMVCLDIVFFSLFACWFSLFIAYIASIQITILA